MLIVVTVLGSSYSYTMHTAKAQPPQDFNFEVELAQTQHGRADLWHNLRHIFSLETQTPLAHEHFVEYLIEHKNTGNSPLLLLLLNLAHVDLKAWLEKSFLGLRFNLKDSDLRGAFHLSDPDSHSFINACQTIQHMTEHFKIEDGEDDTWNNPLELSEITYEQMELCRPYIRALYSLSTIEHLQEQYPRLQHEWPTLVHDCKREIIYQLHNLSLHQQVQLLQADAFLCIRDTTHGINLKDIAVEALAHTIERKLTHIHRSTAFFDCLAQLPSPSQQELICHLLNTSGIREYIHKQHNLQRDFTSTLLRVEDKGTLKNFLYDRYGYIVIGGRLPQGIATLSWSPDGKHIISGSFDGTLCIWDTKTGTCVKRLQERGGLCKLTWSPNGKYIAAAYRQYWHEGPAKIVLYDSQTLIAIYTHIPNASHRIVDLDWSPDGVFLAFAFASHQVYLLNVQTQEIVPTSILIFNPKLRWAPSGQCLAIINDINNELILWNKGQQRIIGLNLDNYITHFSWLPDSEHILLEYSNIDDEKKISIINTTTSITRDMPVSTTRDHYYCSSNNYYLAAKKEGFLSLANSLQLLSPENGELLHSLPGHKRSLIETHQWSSDGFNIASGAGNGTLRITNTIDRDLDRYLINQLTLKQVLFLMRTYYATIKKQKLTISYDPQLIEQHASLDPRVQYAIKSFITTIQNPERLHTLLQKIPQERLKTSLYGWGLLAGYKPSIYTALLQNNEY